MAGCKSRCGNDDARQRQSPASSRATERSEGRPGTHWPGNSMARPGSAPGAFQSRPESHNPAALLNGSRLSLARPIDRDDGAMRISAKSKKHSFVM